MSKLQCIIITLLCLSTLPTFAVGLSLKGTSGATVVQGAQVTVGTANQPWHFPDDNWDFHPPVYQDVTRGTDKYANFTLAFTMKMDGVAFALPPYDVGFHTRYTEPGLLFYHAGVLLRQAGGTGYRLLFSTVSGDVALYKDGPGFLAARSFPLKEGQSYAVEVTAQAQQISVRIDGKPALEYVDTSHPMLKGSLGFFAMHSHTTFDQINLTPLGPMKMEMVSHTAHLTFRPWHHWQWIFDGDEPIARFMRYDVGVQRNTPTDDNGPYRYFGISDAKLRPGTEPATPWQLDWDCDLGGVGKDKYKTIKTFDVQSPQPDTLSFRWELLDQAGAMAGRGTMDVHYDAAQDGYSYDVHSSKVLAAPYNDELLQYSDPWPYRVIGPSTNDQRTWPRKRQYFVYADADGTVRKVALNHHWPMGYHFATGARATFALNEDENPTFELLTTGQPLYGGLCNWGLDLHLQLQFTHAQLPLPKGKEITAHFRVFSSPYKQAAALLQQAKFLDRFQAIADEGRVPLNTGQILNTFGPSSWVKPTEAFDGWIWEGLNEKNWDTTTGKDDHYSLRIDQPGQYTTKDFGAGGFYGVFPGAAYELIGYIKTRDVQGKGCWLSATSWPTPGEQQSVVVTGTSDWTPVRVRFAGPVVGAALSIHLEGKGTAWIDNLQVVPVKPN